MKAIVIGSGIAGLATAIRLARMGYHTQVFEANSFVGGKLSEFNINGFRFDRGPSLFTMPQLVEELFELCGKNPAVEFPYIKLDESCRYFYADGTLFRSFHETSKLSQEVEEVFQVDAQVFLQHLQRSKNMHQYLSNIFMERSLHRLK
ncbi:MAG: phytoene desaturase family protein, partial [Bacteroidota bacterium]